MRTLCLLLLFGGGIATADDARDGRDRAARAALALAAAKPGVPTAPPPRPAPKSYKVGYADAVSDQQPLVVFVSCGVTWPVEGAVVARADQFAGVTGPAVVVGFPVADRLYIDAVLMGEPDAKRVADAAKSAAKKIDGPTPQKMPAPRPLKWEH